ncbi:unnamed protein product [Callosobruchus maculatus]|uniref:Nose resistant-to-fluoxetine protein N-terminal domain-containing protein n=1 Tax=Callosobruchus maculatus TaxID=64391 RepID=A0A653CJ45_CALMS|nr:unnamed protein product [Callosobruchus maculatus]
MYPLNIMNGTKSISPSCKEAYETYLNDLQQSDLDAVKMFDASAKLPSGILKGNVNQYGNFDECMEVKTGQYCLAEIDIRPLWKNPYSKFEEMAHSHFVIQETLDDPKHRVPGFTMIRWGFCIPSACTHKDLEHAIQETMGVESRVNPEMCQKSEKTPEKRSVGKTLAEGFFVLIFSAATVATILEYYNYFSQGKKNAWQRILHCFSLQQNYDELTTIKENPKEIKAVHGCRALAALGLIMSHKALALFYNPYINRSDMTEALGQKWSVVGRTAILFTDVFMLISGLLNANALFSELDKSKKLNFKDKLLSRLFRILPNLIAIILFCTYVLPELGNGPLWPLVVNHHSELCKKYMWRNMLLIHNYFGFENMCLTHTHQVGIDMQLFLVTPLFVYAIWRNREIGWYILIAVASLSTVLRFWVTYDNELSHVVHFGIPISRMFKTADLSYILPTHRATIYLTGVALAYILRYTSNPSRLSQLHRLILWMLTYVLFISTWVGPTNMASIGFHYNKLNAALYAAVSPITFGFAVSYIIYAVDRNFGNWFGPLLTWRYFIFFTKIAYGVYLTQFPIFFYNIGKTKYVGEYRHYMIMEILETAAVILLSIALTLLVEMPFQKLKKVLLDGEAPSSSKTTKINKQPILRKSELG